MRQILWYCSWLALAIAMTSFMLFAQDTNVNSKTVSPDYNVDPLVAAAIAYSQKPVTADEIIATIRADTNSFDAGVASRMKNQRSQLIYMLLDMFRDVRASDDQKCVIVFYLGEMRASQAADDLATNITLHMTHEWYYGGALWPSVPSALVQIGAPSVPGLIKNLRESDNSTVRELSMRVLYSIEGDRDVVQLRLQKALDGQSDTTKKARLQAALKSLPGIKMWPGGLD